MILNQKGLLNGHINSSSLAVDTVMLTPCFTLLEAPPPQGTQWLIRENSDLNLLFI